MKKKILFLAAAFICTLGFAQNQIELLKDFHNGAGGYYSIGEIYEWENQGLTFFNMTSLEFGSELYVTDGTTEGTKLLKDINIGTFDGDPEMFCAAGDYVYFRAFDGLTGNELWKTDGTEEGTSLVRKLNPVSSTLDLFHCGAYNGKLYFCGNKGSGVGYELCVSDGTEEGTDLLVDINTNTNGSSEPNYFTVFNGKLYFSAFDGVNGNELWVTDGTVVGTSMFANIAEGAGSSFPKIMGVCGDKLFFNAYSDALGTELYVTDGTPEGTIMLKDANLTGSSIDMDINFTCFNNKFFYNCDDGIHGNELWMSDGTTEGTNMFVEFCTDLNSSEQALGSNIKNFAVVNNKLYFTAISTILSFQDQLIESDGTPEGTHVYGNLPVAELSNVLTTIVCNNRLFFYGEYPQYFRLMSIGAESSEIVVHSGEGLNYIDIENSSFLGPFFTVADTLCFIGDFNTGIGQAWYRLYYDSSVDVENIQNQDFEFSAFPNPFANVLNLNLENAENCNISITNANGQEVVSKENLDGMVQINLSELPQGIYFLRINSGNKIETQKLIKY